MPIFQRCHTDTGQNLYDLITSLSDQEEKEINGFKDQAFSQLLEDKDLIGDVVSDAADSIRAMMHDANTCDPYAPDATQREINFTSNCWYKLECFMKVKLADQIDELSQQLWREDNA